MYQRVSIRSAATLAAVIGLVPAAALAADSLVTKGKNTFEMKGCGGCHTLGSGDRSGPDLKGVFDRRDLAWVEKWLASPDAVFAANDATANEMLKKFALKMPNMGLTPEDIKGLVAYIAANGGGKPVAKGQPADKAPLVAEPVAKTEVAEHASEAPVQKRSWLSRVRERVRSLFGGKSARAAYSSLDDVAKARGLAPEDIMAAVKTYTPSGKFDPYLMFASGGHSGGVLVIGVPSMRIIKSIPVFTPDSWHGYAVGSTDTEKMLDASSTPGHRKLRWGDVHHPALSETKGIYDGQYLFVNDKASARIAVIDLRDFATKQIVKNPLFVNDHGGAFVSPDTDYVVETSQYNVPLPNRPESLDNFATKYRGATTLWKFDRAKGRIDKDKSFSIELPPYWQDIADFGKKTSDGYYFINSINTEQATGGNLLGKPNFEISASKNDMDLLHVVNWRKAAEAVQRGKFKMVNGMKLLSLENAISEGVLHLIYEPKSPHGVDVSPDGGYIVVSGKLDPHTTVYSFSKIKDAIEKKNYDGKDKYGIPILKFDAVKEAQIEVGLGPLHTQFDSDGYAYTSLFLDSAIAKWQLGTWKLIDKVPVQYNIGHLSCVEGDTAEPGNGYCVALNKWAIDRYPDVGPLMPQNFQLVDTTGEKMKVLYDLPIPNAEPHYVQIVKASRLKPLATYPMGTDPMTMERSRYFTPGGKERIERHGNEVTVYMTLIRSHLTPDRVEVNKGDHVTMHLSNIEAAKDATHGFAISDYNINLSMEPGKVESLEFTADKSGVYPMYCTEFCSALHLEMAGYLIVK